MTLPSGFLELALEVYASNPQWIPEDPEAIQRAFSPQNPWFLQGEAEAFVIPGASRMAVFFEPKTKIKSEPAAFFGFWETMGEAEADAELFARAEAWAKARGARALYGPINFSTFGDYRLRTAAAAEATTYPGEPFNPEHYPKLLAAQGYDIERQYSTLLASEETMSRRCEQRKPSLERAKSAGYRFEPLSRDYWMRHLRSLHQLVDRVFSENFAYTPLGYDAFAYACGEPLLKKVCPQTSLFVYSQEDELVGFYLVYPDYGPLLVQGAGEKRLHPSQVSYQHLSALQSMATQRNPLTGVIKTIAVDPAHRGKGIMTGMVVESVGRNQGLYGRWAAALIREDNHSANFLTGYQDQARYYALYRKAL